MSDGTGWLDRIWAIFNALQGIPLSSRHAWFVTWVFGWAITGVFLFYIIPFLRLAASETKAETEPSAPSMQTVNLGTSNSSRKSASATRDGGAGANSDKSFTAPVQIASSKVGTIVSSPTEISNTNSQSVIAAPIHVGKLSTEALGDVQTTIGSNVQAPKELIAGLYTQNIGGTVNVYINDGTAVVEKTTIKITEKSDGSPGGSAEIEIYTLFNSASWAYKSSSQLLTYKDQSLTLEEFLVSDSFMAEVKTYQAIVCLGLASGAARGELARTVGLSDERATHLCGLVSRKIYATSKDTKVFGLPLGYHTKEVKPQTREERQQRSVVILGIRAASGTLESEEDQHRLITAILKNDGFAQFKSSDYSEVKSGKPLRYLRIERGIYSGQ